MIVDISSGPPDTVLRLTYKRIAISLDDLISFYYNLVWCDKMIDTNLSLSYDIFYIMI